MRSFFYIFPLFFLSLACGSYPTYSEELVCNISPGGSPPLSMELGGTWGGTMQFVANPSISPLPLTAVVSVNGYKGQVEMLGLCPTPVVVPINGCSNHARIHSTIDCVITTRECDSIRTIYKEGLVGGKDPINNGDIILDGMAEGCGVQQTIQVVFSGKRI